MNNPYFAKYVAIIGDIVDSRRLPERQTVQNRLKEVLAGINKKYAGDIASRFAITLGDEFQGLLNSRRNIICIINDIETAMIPVGLRFGIGIGDISTEVVLDSPSEIDGSAYHRARKMINTMKHRKNRYTKVKSGIMICTGEAYPELDELLNSMFAVCAALRSKWSDRQREMIQAYLANEENQYKAAKALGIGQPSVNKSLANARFYAYRSAMNAINSFLGSERAERRV